MAARPILVLLAIIGTIDLARLRNGERLSVRLMGLIGFGWLILSVIGATNSLNRENWVQRRPELLAFKALREDEKACGLAVVNRAWVAQGGYSYLHRPIPIFHLNDRIGSDELRKAAPAFNRMLAEAGIEHRLEPSFQRAACFGRRKNGQNLCLYQRPGPCQPKMGAVHEINTWLRANDI